jgi:hypothetical protein
LVKFGVKLWLLTAFFGKETAIGEFHQPLVGHADPFASVVAGHTGLVGYTGVGQWKKIIPQDCAGCWSVCNAHPPVHIWICAGGCNAVDGPKDKKDVELFFPLTLVHTG